MTSARSAAEGRNLRRELATRGYAVLRAVVPQSAIDDALRHIHLDIVRNGLPPEALGSWLWSAHWFPHLKWDDPIVALARHLPPELREGEPCDPQILLQPPDESLEHAVTPHVDEEPEWAQGRRFLRIVGVALTPAYPQNGGLIVWPLDGGDPKALDLEAGDVVVMDPALPHSSGLNREGAIRYAVYFRYLDARLG